MTRHYAVQDETYTLVFDAPEGVPTGNGTVNVYTSGTNLLDGFSADTTATLSSLDTTMSTAAERYDRSIIVASTTGATTGAPVILDANANGQYERHVIDGVNATSGAIYLVDPVEYDTHTTSSTVKSPRLTASLTTTHTATRRRWCVVRWEYTATVDGVSKTCVHHERLDIVRYDYRAQALPSQEEIESIYPLWSEIIGRRGQDMQAILNGALNEVEFELEAESVEPDQIVDTSKLRYVVALRAIMNAIDSQPGDNELKMERWGQRFSRAWSTLRASPMWVDRDSDGAIDDEAGWTTEEIDGVTVSFRTRDPEHMGIMSERIGLQGGRRFKVG
jgi:hypothetical protein